MVKVIVNTLPVLDTSTCVGVIIAEPCPTMGVFVGVAVKVDVEVGVPVGVAVAVKVGAITLTIGDDAIGWVTSPLNWLSTVNWAVPWVACTTAPGPPPVVAP